MQTYAAVQSKTTWQRLIKFVRSFSAQLLVLSHFLLVTVAVDAAEDDSSLLAASNEQSEQIAAYQQQIAELESEFGPFDQSLIEPLNDLASLYTEIGNLVGANNLLDRQLQLMRITEGLDTYNQQSVLEALIANNVQMNDLEAATENFENLQFVFLQNPDSTTTQKLEAMDEVRHWHFLAINLDEKRRRIHHFRSSRELLRQMLRIAEDEYGEETTEMIPWLYKSALEKYHLLTYLFSHDELGENAFDAIFELEEIQPEQYLRQGYETVKDIREIVQQSGDVEADAMAAVYEADFQMLLGLGTARRSYVEAMELFAEAGKSEQEITDFFARPVPLPITEYYQSMDAAIAAQDAVGYRYERGVDGADPVVYLGNYVAWNESLLNAAMPENPNALADTELELHRADLRFSIRTRGDVRTPDVESTVPEIRQARVDGADALEMMIFRPRFRGERWRTLREVTISYWYPPEK